MAAAVRAALAALCVSCLCVPTTTRQLAVPSEAECGRAKKLKDVQVLIACIDRFREWRRVTASGGCFRSSTHRDGNCCGPPPTHRPPPPAASVSKQASKRANDARTRLAQHTHMHALHATAHHTLVSRMFRTRLPLCRQRKMPSYRPSPPPLHARAHTRAPTRTAHPRTTRTPPHCAPSSSGGAAGGQGPGVGHLECRGDLCRGRRRRGGARLDGEGDGSRRRGPRPGKPVCELARTHSPY